jgi:hypothetical protein
MECSLCTLSHRKDAPPRCNLRLKTATLLESRHRTLPDRHCLTHSQTMVWPGFRFNPFLRETASMGFSFLWLVPERWAQKQDRAMAEHGHPAIKAGVGCAPCTRHSKRRVRIAHASRFETAGTSACALRTLRLLVADPFEVGLEFGFSAHRCCSLLLLYCGDASGRSRQGFPACFHRERPDARESGRVSFVASQLRVPVACVAARHGRRDEAALKGPLGMG